MAIIGVLLIVVGALLVLGGIFGLGYDVVDGSPDERTTEFLGFNVAPEAIFLLGVAAATLILLGLWCLKYGAQRGWRRRREQKKLDELHDKLDEADRAEGRDDRPS
jgi:hypothetical protein